VPIPNTLTGSMTLSQDIINLRWTTRGARSTSAWPTRS
jgi:hypothetical protein